MRRVSVKTKCPSLTKLQNCIKREVKMRTSSSIISKTSYSSYYPECSRSELDRNKTWILRLFMIFTRFMSVLQLSAVAVAHGLNKRHPLSLNIPLPCTEIDYGLEKLIYTFPNGTYEFCSTLWRINNITIYIIKLTLPSTSQKTANLKKSFKNSTKTFDICNNRYSEVMDCKIKLCSQQGNWYN